MVKHHSTAVPEAAILGETPVPLHTYDNWLLPSAEHNKDAQFASSVKDVAHGTRVIASIMANHLIDMQAIVDGGADEVQPLLGDNDIAGLARLAVFTLRELHYMASNQVDRLNAESEKGAQS